MVEPSLGGCFRAVTKVDKASSWNRLMSSAVAGESDMSVALARCQQHFNMRSGAGGETLPVVATFEHRDDAPLAYPGRHLGELLGDPGEVFGVPVETG